MPPTSAGLLREIGVRPTKTLRCKTSSLTETPSAGSFLWPIFMLMKQCLRLVPGLGSLTLGLLDAAKAVVAVEIDPVLAGKLPETVKAWRPHAVDDFHLVLADAMKVTSLPVEPTALVANLPYNVAVPVVLHLLQHFPSLRHGLVMVQDEVADRWLPVLARPTACGPYLKAAWYSSMRKAGVIGMNVFWPAPKISSGLVSFTRREAPVTTALPGNRCSQSLMPLSPSAAKPCVRPSLDGQEALRKPNGACGRQASILQRAARS